MSLIRSLARMRRSIGLVQAVAVLCASVMVGLGLGTAQLAQALADHRSTALARCAEILSLAEGGATGAAWTLDAALAQDVVASMVDAHGVQLATLSDEHGNVLASAWSEPHAATLLTRRFADAFLTAPLAASRRLEVSTDRGRRWVGTLTVELSRLHAAGRFLDRAFDTALTSVITALLVGMILLVLSARLVTSPLRRVARRIAEVDPERPQEHSLDVPPGHEHDELGELIRRTNQMLGRLAVTQRDLRRLATRDPLTGLPNRVLIGERLREAIARARRGGLRVAVLFLDLDRFKTINDSLGHETGDQLLVDVSSVLAESVRANDSVGRLGGDEFVVMLEDVNESDVVEQTVRRIVDALDRPFTVHGREVRTTASVGIAVYPDDGEGVTDLMRHADLAMYRAKQAGGSCWRFFAPELAERVTRRLRAETALASARARGELTVDYQAKVTAADGTLVGCEALLRWTHDGERQDANGFIAVAEDSGLILVGGSWVLDEVCRQIAEWGARGHRVPVAVNVSARQLGDAGFVDMVIATLERHGVETGLLSLEITETALMEDPRRCAALLRRLSRLGVRVSIDDFGTGYASLAYLARLPVQELKIDRMFVSRARSSRSILEAIVAMARSLRLETVAEGIETEEQLAMARQAGCDVVQGYRVGRPMDATAFERAHLAGASAGREVNAR